MEKNNIKLEGRCKYWIDCIDNFSDGCKLSYRKTICCAQMEKCECKNKLIEKLKKKKLQYIHKEIRIGFFRASFYKLKRKFCLRFEISNWK